MAVLIVILNHSSITFALGTRY